jgi:hypothetical protein
MSGSAGRPLEVLQPYLRHDSKILKAHGNFHALTREIKDMRGCILQRAFSAAILELCEYVSHAPPMVVGRVLFCEVAFRNGLMIMCAKSLERFLRIGKHTIHAHVKDIRFIPSTPSAACDPL